MRQATSLIGYGAMLALFFMLFGNTFLASIVGSAGGMLWAIAHAFITSPHRKV